MLLAIVKITMGTVESLAMFTTVIDSEDDETLWLNDDAVEVGAARTSF